MKNSHLLAVLLLAVAGTFATLQPAPAQSLDTRRYLKELHDKDVPEFQKKISDLAGTQIAVELDDASFGDNKSALEGMKFYVFPGLTAGITSAAKDDLGKKALAEKLKKIHIVYDVKVSDPKGITLKDGTMEIHYAFGGGSYLTETQYKSFLEQSL